MDLGSTYVYESTTSTVTERKKRLFWSLQSLEQTYGQQNGPLCIPAEAFRSNYVSNSNDGAMQKEIRENPPPLPTEDIGCSNSSDIGIWGLAIHFGWVWSKVRTYVSDCAENKLEEPWRYNSLYARVLSDLTEIENRLSQCHRYDSVKFYERTAEELKTGREYWAPWLNLQFTYHSTLTVLNHPFLYIVASQYNNNLTIPNAFWRRSAELVLLHATWIVRMIDMVSDKDMGLTDPFFGHAAAIAATVHLYYCSSADSRLKLKSMVDLRKCMQFLKSFSSFSAACEDLVSYPKSKVAGGSSC